MAEITLKKKITLRRKEEQAAFTFSGKLLKFPTPNKEGGK